MNYIEFLFGSLLVICLSVMTLGAVVAAIGLCYNIWSKK